MSSAGRGDPAIPASPRGSGESAYRAAGVDIDEGMRAVARIRDLVRTTYTAGVESEVGAFAGFFSYPDPGGERLLVASMDGVGTKLKIAAMAGRWRGVGYDIVSHCVNDILVHGATPLFFLDYIGAGRLSAAVAGELVEGMAEACREARCALIGGETAEMPGMYPPGELDLVGTIVGEVKRTELIDGRAIRPGDRLLGLASAGLHTNGYSLARKVLDLDDRPERLEEPVDGERETLGDLLLRRHRMYLNALLPLLRVRETDPTAAGPEPRLRADGRGAPLLLGLAHITGGGILDNLPRVLPPGVRAVVSRGAWPEPPLFRLLRERGNLATDECYRVFNMGIGMILIIRPENVEEVVRRLQEANEPPVRLGWCEAGPSSVRWAEGSEAG